MSWSFSAVGFPGAVADKVAEQLANQKCAEPEETIKGHVTSILQTSLKAYPDGYVVKVNAYGSQYVPDPAGAPGKAVNTVTLSIETMAGFVS